MKQETYVETMPQVSTRLRTLLAAFCLALPVAARAQSTDTAASAPAASPLIAIVAAAQGYLDTLHRDQLMKAWLPFQSTAIPTVAQYTRSGGPKGGGPGGAIGGQPDRDANAQGVPSQNGGKGPGGQGGGMGNFVGERYGQAVWSNYPASDVLRPGLPLGEMSGVQRAAAMDLLRAALSDKGFAKVQAIMGADQALHEQGTNYASGVDTYTLGIFGTPSQTDPWMIQFGAHHLGVNLVIRGGTGTITPTMTGAQPANYSDADGKSHRALAAENDKAFAMLESLSDDQKIKAVLDYEVDDLVYGPGGTGGPLLPEGIKGSELAEVQKDLLLDLIGEWAGIVNDSWAGPRMAEIEDGVDETWFAWSGPLTHEPDRNGSSYYRIQGPHLIIEFAPQGVGGDKTMHVHTVYRDPTNDYGLGGGKQ